MAKPTNRASALQIQTWALVRLVVRYRPSLAVSLVVTACIYRAGSKATATGQIAVTTFPKRPWEVHQRVVARVVLELNIQSDRVGFRQ